MKQCKRCEEVLPLCEFYKRSASPDGLRYECRRCSNEIATKWRLNNRDHRNEYQRNRLREWSEMHPGERTKYNEPYLNKYLEKNKWFCDGCLKFHRYTVAKNEIGSKFYCDRAINRFNKTGKYAK